jgi:hypothetical protein
MQSAYGRDTIASIRRPNLRERSMKQMVLAGVLLLVMVGSSVPAVAADVRMFIKHEVTDYPAWRKAYNDFDKQRRKLGALRAAVYQSVDNPNDVTVTHDFKTPDKAKAFAASEDLKSTMQKAGVKGTPQIWYTTEAKK